MGHFIDYVDIVNKVSHIEMSTLQVVTFSQRGVRSCRMRQHAVLDLVARTMIMIIAHASEPFSQTTTSLTRGNAT